ncbi:MAG: hypothetical protein OEU54_02230 [Gemmatimonadota bacterium]|nr:hypothetical protein [Gemmatimonadota bacterium]
MKYVRLVGAGLLGYAVFALGLSGIVIAVWHEGWIQPVGVWIVLIVLAQLVLGWVTGAATALAGGPFGGLAVYAVAVLILVVTLANIWMDVAVEPTWFKLCVIGFVAPTVVLVGRRRAARSSKP